MIYGIGNDLVEIKRIQRILSGKTGERFRERLLTTAERQVRASKKGREAEWLAGRFAAKEAVAKALGCGIGVFLSFHDMDIWNDHTGKPEVTIRAESRSNLRLDENAVVHISITHTAEYAAAFALIERRG